MKSRQLATCVKLTSVIAMLFVSGCAEINKRILDDTLPSGNEFNDTLAKEYETLGNTEQSIMFDEISANFYYKRAILAKDGNIVLPTCLNYWDIPEDKLPELERARARLMRALDYGARTEAPKMTAYAQSHFDCWVEQQAEGWQKEDIANCRAAFYTAMGEVELILMGGFTNVAPTNMVFFNLESSRIDSAGKKTIDQIAKQALAEQNRVEHILLVGRTDKVGDAKYNTKLSAQRAMNVKKELIRRGVAPNRIAIKAAGEAPGPNVDSHNRRVDIIFLEYK
jgi:OOP family OmpA-OmpF porin